MNQSLKSKKGFTLIELLVVIAIIGILSAIVLAALGSARSSAKEASILSALRQAQTQAELHNLSAGSYSGLCDDEKIQEIVASASSTGDGAACWVSTDLYSGGDYQVELAMRDYGIGVKLDDTYYATSPLGVGAFDEENSGVINWDTANTVCNNAAKRLASPSEFRAIWTIANDTPEGFTADYNWSALESSTNLSEAYRAGLHTGNGFVIQDPKTRSEHVRCID